MASKKKLEAQMEEAAQLEAAEASFNEMFESEDWVEDSQSGLPPYWKAAMNGQSAVGQFFRGIPMMIDNKDPNFIRYVMQATIPLTCYRGPVDSAEAVSVQPGELFTISSYAGLDMVRYLGFEIAAIIVEDTQLAPTAEIAVRNFYRWKIRVPRETMKQLQEMRVEETKLLRIEAQNFARKRMLERRNEILQMQEGGQTKTAAPAEMTS
jgi:hypothetical protein